MTVRPASVVPDNSGVLSDTNDPLEGVVMVITGGSASIVKLHNAKELELREALSIICKLHPEKLPFVPVM